MGRRLNYGKRFGQGGARLTYDYDPALDVKPPFAWRNPSPLGRVFGQAKTQAIQRARAAKRAAEKEAAGPSEYEQAEHHLIETVRVAVNAMQFALNQLNEARGQPTTRLHRKAVIDSVDKLKTALQYVGIKDWSR